jgi:hypothetical protein
MIHAPAVLAKIMDLSTTNSDIIKPPKNLPLLLVTEKATFPRVRLTR